MEFGIFVQGYTPQFRRDTDPEAEHHALMNELELVKAADEAGFKYVWATEHHFLDEYSHLSANEVFLGYLAHCTERIHLGSGIFNPLPQVNHPAKVAEKVAMLDHLSGGRVEFGTGRGAGSHEILGFLPDMKDLSGTKEIWEDVIREFPKMWTQETYEGYEGKYWSLPPRKILPKPYVKPHPPMWYAAGNTSSYAMAARYGLGVLGFLGRQHRRARAGARGLQARHRERGADRRVRERQRDGHQCGVRRRGPRGGGAVHGRGSPVVPAEQRVPLPRHVPAPRLGTAVARAAPRPDRRRGPGRARHPGHDRGRPRTTR